MKSRLAILMALFALVASTLACLASGPAGVSNIYMASDEAGDIKTTTFGPMDSVYVFFDVNQVEAGTKFEIKWFVLDLEGQDPATPFTVSEYTYDNEDTIYANVYSTDPAGFPAAQYKVEIYMAGAKVGEQQFGIGE